MKILVSTKNTQGQRKNDFCFVPEGEIVIPGERCSGGTCDDDCGCSRSMTGIKCRKGTTTFIVADNPLITYTSLIEKIMKSQKDAGLSVTKKVAESMAEGIIFPASQYKVGTIMELREKGIVPRKVIKMVVHKGVELPEKDVKMDIAMDELVSQMIGD